LGNRSQNLGRKLAGVCRDGGDKMMIVMMVKKVTMVMMMTVKAPPALVLRWRW
jgi:hypothetical protein